MHVSNKLIDANEAAIGVAVEYLGKLLRVSYNSKIVGIGGGLNNGRR